MLHPQPYIHKYFGEKGLTPASASHVANLAKEYYRVIEKKLEGLSLCDTYIQSVACSERIQVRKATSESDFASIPTLLEKIGKAKALIAWLREAVKAHELLVKSDIQTDYVLYGDIEDIKYVEIPPKPVFNDNPSDEDVIKDEADLILSRYARDMDEMVFVFGATLFNNKKKDLETVKMHPLDISRPQHQIYRAQCVSTEIINKTEDSIVFYYDIVERYGDWDSDKINRVYNEQYSMLLDEHWQKLNEARKINNLYSEAIRARHYKLLEQYARHRIIIPDTLKGIYEEISLLGKKND